MRGVIENSVRRCAEASISNINEHATEINEYPYASSGILACNRKDHVGFWLCVEHGFLAPKISCWKFRLSYFSNASDGNRVDAED